MMVFLSVTLIHAADPPKSFVWKSPNVVHSLFARDLGMLDSEREEYATNLASYAANQIAQAKASSQSLADARRVLALALHLSPRNRRAIVLNFQLSKGMMPEISSATYSSQSLARLLLSRGKLLETQGGDDNKLLARMLVQLAAGIDPKNEDAVYASEVHRLDYGPVDWAPLTDCPEPNRS